MLGYLFKRLCGRARRACERCRPRARAVCRFVRRRFVWVVLICTIGVEFLILDSWLAATVVELLRSGLLTAWFLLVGRLVWRFVQLGAARWQPA
jgi:hypothetical protein